jgi:hypothetical protein
MDFSKPAVSDGDALGFQRVLREVEREAIGVVELEGDVARERAAFGEISGFLVEELEAALERGFETGFLPVSVFR